MGREELKRIAREPDLDMLLTDKLSKVLEAADLHITAVVMEMTEEFGQVGFWRFNPRKERWNLKKEGVTSLE